MITYDIFSAPNGSLYPVLLNFISVFIFSVFEHLNYADGRLNLHLYFTLGQLFDLGREEAKIQLFAFLTDYIY
jgi:hypothetical protein